ncbi:MAG: helix-turn-helix transcriptional regulator [Actinomycetota bacterium]
MGSISTSQSFAELFRESRADKGWTQEYAAREIGVTLKSVQKWESGNTQPKWPAILRCAAVFGWELSVVKEMG